MDLLGPANQPSPKPRKSRTLSTPVLRLIDQYHREYLARHGVKPIIHGGKDGAILKRLVAAWGEERVSHLLTRYLSENDPWAVRRGWTVDAFENVACRMQTDKSNGNGNGHHSDRVTQSNMDVIRRASQRRE